MPTIIGGFTMIKGETIPQKLVDVIAEVGCKAPFDVQALEVSQNVDLVANVKFSVEQEGGEIAFVAKPDEVSEKTD